MNHVGEEIVVLEAIVDVHFLVVDRERSRLDAALLLKKKNNIAPGAH